MTKPFQIEVADDEFTGGKWTIQWAETRPPKKQKTNPRRKNVNPFLALIAERRKQKKIDQFQASNSKLMTWKRMGPGSSRKTKSNR